MRSKRNNTEKMGYKIKVLSIVRNFRKGKGQ